MLGFWGVVGALRITRYAREGCAYTKGFKLAIAYPQFRNYDSLVYGEKE